MGWLRFFTCWTFILGWTAHFRVVDCDLLIIRKVNRKDTYHRDRFNIQRTKCTDIRQGNKCGVYGGFERSPNNPCKCHCPPRRGTITRENQQWRCRSNEALRQREDCGFYFLYESSDSFVKMIIANQWQFFNAPKSQCTPSNISYLTCDGSWVQIPTMTKHVDVTMQGFDQVARGYAYKIRVKKKGFLAGKLIKLYLTCSPYGGQPCLLIKMKGTQNCFTKTGSQIGKKRKKRKRKRKKKKNKKFSRVSFLPSSSMVNEISSSHLKKKMILNWTLLNDVMIRQKNNITQMRAGNFSPKVKDRKVMTLILTFTAVFFGVVVLGLGINLCFCSTNQESYRGKHIFRRADPKGVTRLRTPSDSTITSHSSSIKLEISSKQSGTPPSSIYETEIDSGLFVDGQSYSNALSRCEGVS